MAKRVVLSVLALALFPALSSCIGTSGGSQFDNTVYSTYQRVRNLDRNLQSSVTQLGETTSTLLARVEESDGQLRNVQGVLEDNRAKLASLEKKLDTLTNTIYRAQGRTLLPGAPSQPQPSTEIGVGNDAYGVTPGGVAPDAVAPGAAPPPVPPSAPADPNAVALQPPEQPALEPVAVGEPGPDPTAPPATSGSPDADYLQAQKSYARQDYESALEQFGSFLQRYPLSSQAQNAQFWRAKSFQALERYEEAIAEYNRLRDAYPATAGDAANSKVPSAMHQQAVCHARLGQTERAVELFKQVIRDFPNSPAAAQATSDLQRLQ